MAVSLAGVTTRHGPCWQWGRTVVAGGEGRMVVVGRGGAGELLGREFREFKCVIVTVTSGASVTLPT